MRDCLINWMHLQNPSFIEPLDFFFPSWSCSEIFKGALLIKIIHKHEYIGCNIQHLSLVLLFSPFLCSEWLMIWFARKVASNWLRWSSIIQDTGVYHHLSDSEADTCMRNVPCYSHLFCHLPYLKLIIPFSLVYKCSCFCRPFINFWNLIMIFLQGFCSLLFCFSLQSQQTNYHWIEKTKSSRLP